MGGNRPFVRSGRGPGTVRGIMSLPPGLTELIESLDRPRILDFGCGYGRNAVELLEAGHDVWGVDISEQEVARGHEYLAERGHDPARLSVLDGDGRARHDAGSFDLVFSDQVFEHVAHLEPTISEIARLSKPGGHGLHSWPARFRPVEPHLTMPLVHWLPKNGVRRRAIATFIRAGVRPPWPEQVPEGDTARLAEFEYRYSINETFYRPYAEVAGAFRRHGLDVEPHPHHRLRGLPLGTLRPAAEWGMRTFVMANVRTRAA
jgi:SAM-dependent methyltransferase